MTVQKQSPSNRHVSIVVTVSAVTVGDTDVSFTILERKLIDEAKESLHCRGPFPTIERYSTDYTSIVRSFDHSGTHDES